MPPDFTSTAPTTAAVRLPFTGAPHRSKGAFHAYRWAFSHQAVGRVDVDHVQLVIRSSHRRLLRSCPGAVLRFLRVVPRSETRVRGRSAAPTRIIEPQHARVGLRVETDPCSARTGPGCAVQTTRDKGSQTCASARALARGRTRTISAGLYPCHAARTIFSRVVRQ